MATSSRAITVEQFLELSPEEPQWRTELVRGEVCRVSWPGPRHGAVAMRLGISLGVHVRERQLGVVMTDAGYIIERDPDTMRTPDISLVGSDRMQPGHEGLRPFDGAPDLAAEVLSPNDRFREVLEKVHAWLDAGVRLMLVVDPADRSVTVHHSHRDFTRFGDGDVVLGGDVVPGWSLPVAELFS